MPELTAHQVDRLMSVLDKLDSVLGLYDTAKRPRIRTKVVYRDPPDPKAVDLAQLADSINRRLTLLEARGILPVAPPSKPVVEPPAREDGA